jgi:heme o synthase
MATVARPPYPISTHAAVADFWALTKPEINLLIGIATLTGFFMGLPSELHGVPFTLLIHTLAATLLVSRGAGALNQYIERGCDAETRRITRRPLAAGKLDAATALRFGILPSFTGVIYPALAVNLLAALLTALTLAAYLALYTPLKRRTPLCTVVGALPGAAPPLIGWAAASGEAKFRGMGLVGDALPLAVSPISWPLHGGIATIMRVPDTWCSSR